MKSKHKKTQLLKGRYRKGKLLGKGGMAITFLGLDLKENRPIAIKEMRPELRIKQGLRARFKREITLQESLKQENIIKVLDHSLDTNNPFAILEYAEKRSITRFTKNVNMPTRISWILQVLKGIKYIHSRGYVHRDISPENTLLDNQDVIKISDFGLCIPFKRAKGAILTEANQIGGKEAYMAPEQWKRFDKVDWRADIYSLGVVFYYILSNGSLPRYNIDTSCDFAFDMMHAYRWIVDRKRTPPLGANLRVPPIFDDIIFGKMLRYKINERRISADRILDCLKPLTEAPVDDMKLLDSLSWNALDRLKRTWAEGGRSSFSGGEAWFGPAELVQKGLAFTYEETWWETEEGDELEVEVRLKPKAMQICNWWLSRFRP